MVATTDFLIEWVEALARPFQGPYKMGKTSGTWSQSVSSGLFVNEVLGQAGINDFHPAQVIQVDCELMVVNAVPNDPQNGQLEVTRGYLGTPDTGHANQSFITLNPQVYWADVWDYINEALERMYPTVFDVGELTLTYNTSAIGYDLTGMSAGAGKPIAVLAEMDSSAGLWQPIYDWHFEPKVPTADFASGKALMLRTSLPYGARIHVVYPKPFTQIPANDDLTYSELPSDMGLTQYMMPVVENYVKGQLYGNREGRRGMIDTAVTHQRGQDVPAYQNLRTADWFMARFRDSLQSARHTQQQELRTIRGSGYGS